MFPTQQLIMNSSKLRQFYRLIYIKSSPQSLCVPSRTFARDKLLKIDACNTISTHGKRKRLMKLENYLEVFTFQRIILPNSIVGEVANTLLRLSEKDFKEKFNREKPSKDTKIILSCRSGKRSSMVQEEIQKLGYQNAYNYVGGWLDWENNQKV